MFILTNLKEKIESFYEPQPIFSPMELGPVVGAVMDERVWGLQSAPFLAIMSGDHGMADLLSAFSRLTSDPCEFYKLSRDKELFDREYLTPALSELLDSKNVRLPRYYDVVSQFDTVNSWLIWLAGKDLPGVRWHDGLVTGGGLIRRGYQLRTWCKGRGGSKVRFLESPWGDEERPISGPSWVDKDITLSDTLENLRDLYLLVYGPYSHHVRFPGSVGAKTLGQVITEGPGRDYGRRVFGQNHGKPSWYGLCHSLNYDDVVLGQEEIQVLGKYYNLLRGVYPESFS